MRRFVFAAALCLVASPVWAKKGGKKAADDAPMAMNAARPDKETWHMPAPIQMVELTVQDGLPQSQVFAIAQDKVGFLWFGTQAGAARYDGYDFRVYREGGPDPSRSLSSNYVTALAADSAGRVWIGTGDKGLNRWDPDSDTIKQYHHDEKNPKSLSSDGIITLLADENAVWIGTNGGGLCRLDIAAESFETFTLRELDIPADASIAAITKDKSGNLWLGAGGVLVRLDPVKRAAQQWTISGAPIGALHVTAEGRVWIGTKGDGLYDFDPRDGKNIRYRSVSDDPSSLSDDRVAVLLEDSRGSLWVGTARGVNELPKGGSGFSRYVYTPGVASTGTFPVEVNAAIQDRSGVIWFGTITGLRKITELARSLNHYYIDEFVSGSLIDKSGTVWAGTYEGGLYRFDRKNRRITHYRALTLASGGRLPLESWVTTLHEGSDGLLWLSAVGLGLVAFDPRTEATEQFELTPGSAEQRIDRIVETDPNTFWLATWGTGLTRFDRRSGRFESYANDEYEPSSPASNHLYTLHQDTKNPTILWLGTADAGLDRFDIATKTAKHFPPDPKSGPSHASVTAIHQDASGVLWLGTYDKGLNKYDPASDKFSYFSMRDGLSHDQIYGIEEDKDGRLWMSTNGGGLSVLDPKSGVFLSLDARDGLQSNEFIQNGHYRAPSGEMVFAGTKGLNVFDPAGVRIDSRPPPLALTSFRLFNQETPLQRPIWTLPKLDLSYTDSVFSFEFAALDFANPHKNRYSYQLEGFDDRWVESTQRDVTFTNLDGGDYVFRVRAANRSGTWTESALEVPFYMAPPPWKTWWAYLLYVVTIGGAALGYVRYQQQRVRSLEQANRLNAVERDLELTGVIQTGFLPQENTVNGGAFKLLGYYRPADFASGDWWWHEKHGDLHAVLVGDVTGHGAGPAMVTAAVATAFRVQSDDSSFEHKLNTVNDQVLSVGKGKYHMTMSAVVLDERTGQFVFYSAGGLPLICIGVDGKARVVACRGTPLGTQSFKFGRMDGQLAPGERMIVCTDGIPELQLPNGRMLGMRGFTRICERTRSVDLEQAVQTIVKEADKARQNLRQEDDWTFALIEWGRGN